MLRPQEDDLSDETFPPLPPPSSPGQGAGQEGGLFGEAEEGELSKLADVPAAKPKGVKRPQPKLDSQRLVSDRGLPALRSLFHNVHFKGRGHEAEDLRLLMLRMENWAHRLFPKLQFEDFIQKVEKLGAKKEVQTCLKRIRLDMPLTHDDFQEGDGEEEVPPEFLRLQDINPFSAESSGHVHSTPAPPAPSTPSLTEEQLRLIEVNRQRALQRRLARLQPTEPAASQTDVLSTPDQPAAVGPAQVLNPPTDQEETPEEPHQQPLCPPSSDAEPPAGSPVAVSPAEPLIDSEAEPPPGSPVEPPGGSPVEPPGGSPVEPPVGSPVEPPGGSPVEPPGGSPVEPPGGSPVEPPGGSPVEPPGGSPVEPPGGSPVEPPGGSPVEPPGGSPVEPPGGSPVEPPGGSPVEPPGGSSQGEDQSSAGLEPALSL